MPQDWEGATQCPSVLLLSVVPQRDLPSWLESPVVIAQRCQQRAATLHSPDCPLHCKQVLPKVSSDPRKPLAAQVQEVIMALVLQDHFRQREKIPWARPALQGAQGAVGTRQVGQRLTWGCLAAPQMGGGLGTKLKTSTQLPVLTFVTLRIDFLGHFVLVENSRVLSLHRQNMLETCLG